VSNTFTIRRLTPSCRRQLSSIALIWHMADWNLNSPIHHIFKHCVLLRVLD
jgi:hypothetical protein